MTGENARSMAPVAGSKAKIPRWANVAPPFAGEFWIWVNDPATTIRLPTCAKSKTLLSRTCGVRASGTAPTTPACAVPAAPAVPGTARVRTTVALRAAHIDLRKTCMTRIPPWDEEGGADGGAAPAGAGLLPPGTSAPGHVALARTMDQVAPR